MNKPESERFTTFAIGPDEPKENVGPWLKDSKEWWVFNYEKKRYVPIYDGGEN